MACGTLVAAIALQATSAMGYALLAVATAASLYMMFKGPRHAPAAFAAGVVATAFSYFETTPPQAPAAMTDGEPHSLVLLAESVRDGRVGQKCVATALYADGSPCRPFRCDVVLADNTSGLRAGDVFRIDAALPEPVGRFADVPYMDMEAMNARAEGSSALIVALPEQIGVVGRSHALRFGLLDLRDELEERVYSTSLTPRVAALLVAATLGTGDAPPDIDQLFRATGLSHLLCVSGFHVGVVAWLVSLALWPLRLWSHAGRWRYAVLILAVWFYVALVGLSASAVRAAIMISVFYAARLMQRQVSPFNSLALAVALIIIVCPRWLCSAGFQLSVSAVAGLMLFGRRLNMVPERYHWLHRVAELFVVPLAAMAGTAPVILAWFHRLPLLSVPVNALASVVFVPFMVLGGVAVALDCIGVSTAWLNALLGTMADSIVNLCDTAAAFDAGPLYIGTLGILALAVAMTLLALAIRPLHKYARIACACAATLLVAGATLWRPESTGNEALVYGTRLGTEVYVRQGDRGIILPLKPRHRPLRDVSDYFLGMGVAPDSIVYNPSDVDMRSLGISVPGDVGPARYMILDKRGIYALPEVLAGGKPHTLIIGADVSRADREAAMALGAQNGVEVLSLHGKALRIRL